MKTNELTGLALDWAVAKCENVVYHGPAWTKFSVDWAQGGPIIEREEIFLAKSLRGCWNAVAYDAQHTATAFEDGPTPLIAAMRCYVASKLGDDVDIPEELIGDGIPSRKELTLTNILRRTNMPD